MKKIFVTISLIIFITLIAGTTFARTGTVNTDSLNLRKTASTSAEVITQLDKNTKVEILDELDDWYKVSYKNQEGYLKKQYLDAEAETTPNVDNTANSKNEDSTNSNTDVNEDSTNQNTDATSNNQSALLKDAIVYALPILNATKVATLQVNTNVEIISRVGNWYYILTDNTSGWILASKLSEATNSEPNDTTNNADNKLTNSTGNNTANTNSENSVTNNTTNQNSEGKSEYPKTMYVNVDAVNVRDKASTNSDIIASKELNNEVIVTGVSGDWYTVNINGTKGYIKKDYLSDSKK